MIPKYWKWTASFARVAIAKFRLGNRLALLASGRPVYLGRGVRLKVFDAEEVCDEFAGGPIFIGNRYGIAANAIVSKGISICNGILIGGCRYALSRDSWNVRRVRYDAAYANFFMRMV